MASLESQLTQRRQIAKLVKDQADQQGKFGTLCVSLEAMSRDFQRRLGQLEMSMEAFQTALLEECAPRRWWWPFHRHGLSKERAKAIRQMIIDRRIEMSALDAIADGLRELGEAIDAQKQEHLNRTIQESTGQIEELGETAQQEETATAAS